MKLLNPSHAGLNMMFVKHVCCREISSDGFMRLKNERLSGPHTTFESWQRIPDFVSSADLVLPWLEKMRDRYEVSIVFRKQEPFIWVSIGAFGKIGSCDDCNSLPRAIVIALLRAHGVEVEFT